MGNWKRLIFWDFKRGSWQYDIVVVLILAFIFVTPRDVFRDQPKAPAVVRLPSDPGANLFWIEQDLLQPVPEAGRLEHAGQLLKGKLAAGETPARIQPILDAEQEVKGFLVYTKPR